MKTARRLTKWRTASGPGVGTTRVGERVLRFRIQDDTGAVPLNLPAVAADYTFRIQNIRAGTVSAGAGTFSVVSTSLGQVNYQVATADCATPGKFRF